RARQECNGGVIEMAHVPPQAPSPPATVVLLRDAAHGCEALLVRRNPHLSFHGGAWVFPGGRVDQGDYLAAGIGADAVRAARYAAVREAAGEAGGVIAGDRLVMLSRGL